jgi:hypothetical protein
LGNKKPALVAGVDFPGVGLKSSKIFDLQYDVSIFNKYLE